jgi:hypothetical protein
MILLIVAIVAALCVFGLIRALFVPALILGLIGYGIVTFQGYFGTPAAATAAQTVAATSDGSQSPEFKSLLARLNAENP